MAELIEEVLVPTEEVVEMRRGAKVTADRKFFPGYVLVRMELTDETWHLVKNTPKVTGFLGGKGRPSPIRDSEAERIIHQVKEGVDRPKPSITFEIGEQVRVCDGPFNSFNGYVEEVDEEQRTAQGCCQHLWSCNPGGSGIFAGRKALRHGSVRGRLAKARTTHSEEPDHDHGHKRTERTWLRKSTATYQAADAGGAGKPVAASRPGPRPGRPQHHGILQGLQRRDAEAWNRDADSGRHHRVSDRTFSFITKTPPASFFLEESREGEQGSGRCRTRTRSARSPWRRFAKLRNEDEGSERRMTSTPLHR